MSSVRVVSLVFFCMSRLTPTSYVQYVTLSCHPPPPLWFETDSLLGNCGHLCALD
uniref:Uncharacterized protein n=1 Tax=Anguilla anguilla TaxID=7936 RepID=A0A0E9V853_ANGAN